MRALLVKSYGDPTLAPSENGPLFVDEDHPRPRMVSNSSVRVRVAAASVNFATVLSIEGKYQEKPALPFTPGGDFSGAVIEVGDHVKRVKVGDHVCGVVDLGSYAEELVTDEKYLYKVPSGCDLIAAAGLPVAFGTSHVGLVHRANLRRGQVLLVLGAAGGVGLAAVQIGKLCGAIVIATARGSSKTSLLRSMGADLAVDSGTESLLKAVPAFLKSRKLSGVDVLYDPVGGKHFKEGLRLCCWGAQIIIVGFASGEIPSLPANIALVKNLTVHGLYWGSYKVHHPEVLETSLQQLIEMLADGSIQINVSHTYDLSEVNLAFSSIVQREVLGKVVVVFDGDKESKLGSERKSRL
ncbi:hypothetical protein SELMODRAFT_153092 [Selaginella moellendorffii]|uniref:Enoyl reductase (ER) domain-containing protein n=1 Tax=Selaginella moellendorffii TaxID=88036 RepID=D8S6G9_SELML|nr:quinone oxidoreductase-like protein 2 homolog [Selaginella moellendorffii]EFJ19942.1 hypothetical protein SELMODRAFT_153092 [Selaginella moellendorffii]|eukprot:XP_002978985.1 quinone oxidoreductase-like protein 2 homolog [Selaginella moellendorffii]